VTSDARTARESAPASPRERRRRQHRDLSRTQILDAAEEVFADKGYHEATIKEISARAEFSVGAVYEFFENKDDLFAQLYARRGAEFMAGMRAVLDAPGSPRARLHNLAEFQIAFFREHAAFGRLFIRVPSLPERSVADNYTEAMTLQSKLFREGQDAGELRDGDPDVLASLFSGLVAAYQATDPVIIDGAAPGTERMALTEFHDVLDAAFAA
jgi:TetR/AcrR family transcriptional regulator